MYRVISQRGDSPWELKAEFAGKPAAMAIAKQTARQGNHVIVRRHTANGAKLVWEGSGHDVFYPR